LIINKNGNGAADIDIFITDMTTAESDNVVNNQGFDHTSYNPSTTDMGFYATNAAGSAQDYSEFDAGIFEFNTEPYTQTQREAFVARRPEV
jgi:hypothetical protein